ncbi:MAG: STAS/SEC14 domain-containing protein [Sandaracinus sp.]
MTALVRFAGHLTAEGVRTGLLGVATSGERTGIVVDCLAMTGYDLEARHAFVAWHTRNAGRVARVAIVTTNPLHHMVIRAMSLAAGVPMRAFSVLVEAERWAADAR